MFTGIVEEIGTIREIKRLNRFFRIRIQADRILDDAHIDDSVAVQGICLTLTGVRKPCFEVDAVEETIKKTTLGQFRPGHRVNLERALTPNSRLGGHFVLGHVDGRGRIASVTQQGESRVIKIEIPASLIRYAVDKGSVTVDGVSLTISGIEGSSVWIAVIPHTLQNTTLSDLRAGNRVNIEMDVLGKYVERLAGSRDRNTGQESLQSLMNSWIGNTVKKDESPL